MRKLFREILFFIYRRFKLLWILFTIFLLIIVSYVNWHNNIQNSFSSTVETARKLPQNINSQAYQDFLITLVDKVQTIVNEFWYRQILLFIDILMICFVLYFLIKNLFNKYYSLRGVIKEAIKNKKFYPVYQPLFDTKSNTFSGAEVLLRWKDKQNLTIAPDFYIKEAESTGLIVPITLQIIETAFKETKTILKDNPAFYLSFNICAMHFTDDKFFDQFYTLMKRYSIPSKQVLLEITERYLLDKDNEVHINQMNELRGLGYSLALDDYGIGHSSINYLQHFPFNYLKIDKLFIHAIGTETTTKTLADAIINLAKKMNLTIIAEGVETIEQVDYLLQNEIQFLQGWYYSKTLSVEQLVDLLKGEKK